MCKSKLVLDEKVKTNRWVANEFYKNVKSKKMVN